MGPLAASTGHTCAMGILTCVRVLIAAETWFFPEERQ
jgi:hypothetical protein